MSDTTRVRRNIHTYPFKYEYLDPSEFFAPESAVIYLHIPFCQRKCHFCDYVVYTHTKDEQRERYVQALCKEIERFPDNPVFPRFRIDSVYFGGGTPGLLEAEQLERILDTCRRTFEFLPGAEIGVEFDPGNIEADKLSHLYDAGFNRLSVGIQSFHDTVLKANNRPHDLAECFRAWDVIQKSGFTHTNLDLIYPLVGQDAEIWEDSLRQAIDLGPACITAYPLEVWPDTAYHKWLTSGKRQLPPGDAEVEMARRAFDILEAAGYVRDSTSGYYHPDRTSKYCRFLDYYWRTWPMIGFGVGSKSVIHDRLYTNIRSAEDYIERLTLGQSVMDFGTWLTKQQEMRRVMIRGLKMNWVSKPDFFERFGVNMETMFMPEIDSLVERGFLVNDPDQIYLTREGQVFSSNVYETFYTEDDLRAPTQNEVQFGISELITA
jgi:oxygen-independent coproporphyrinogen-3 oxidase